MSARSNSQVSNQIDIRSGSSQHIRLPAIPCRAWLNYVLHVRLQMLVPGKGKTQRAYVWAYATTQFAD
ncbi:IS66 family transposase, partial [Burkholderia ubonensis]|uniref:IS66 family transposase n=1 Tax=Burkholderia ubonensis TaxID=101571 RepID=UPI001E4EEA67